jgi:hypothetical protein
MFYYYFFELLSPSSSSSSSYSSLDEDTSATAAAECGAPLSACSNCSILFWICSICWPYSASERNLIFPWSDSDACTQLRLLPLIFASSVVAAPTDASINYAAAGLGFTT